MRQMIVGLVFFLLLSVGFGQEDPQDDESETGGRLEWVTIRTTTREAPKSFIPVYVRLFGGVPGDHLGVRVREVDAMLCIAVTSDYPERLMVSAQIVLIRKDDWEKRVFVGVVEVPKAGTSTECVYPMPLDLSAIRIDLGKPPDPAVEER